MHNAADKYQGLSNEELIAKLATLELEAAKGKSNGSKVSWKVSEKGGVSVYGIGRFPVTLYSSQWRSLLGNAQAIAQFVEEQDAAGMLASKPAKDPR